MKKYLFYCFLFLNLSTISAQISTLTIQGTVVDSLTKSGIPYVNIGFPAYSTGTSSNELGAYIIKIPKERLNDSLTFSSIGYATLKITVKDLNKEKNARIVLKATDISLAEFTVKALDANKLLKLFFKNLEKNYATKPALMQLFCRETMKKADENLYFAQSEGIVEMYKSSVKKNDDHVRLIKGRKKNLSNIYSDKEGKGFEINEVINGPTIGIILDIVKKNEFFLLKNNQFNFLHNGYESINDRMNYVIYFAPKDTTVRSLEFGDADFYMGKIFMDTATFAIVRADFEFSPRGIRTNNSNMRGLPLSINSRKFVINYAEYNNKWYFKSANVQNDYWHTAAKIPLTNKLEAFVTQIKTDSVKKFSLEDEIKEYESLEKKITNFDDSFWEEYNFIKSAETAQDTSSENSPEPSVEKTENTLRKEKKDALIVDNHREKNVKFIKGGLKEAMKLAAAQKKFIFIDVYTTWCGPCKLMAREAFTDEDVSELMNTFLINLQVDAEAGGRSIAQKYNVRAYPTTLIIDSTGALIAENKGYYGVKTFIDQIEEPIALTTRGSAYFTIRQAYLKRKKDFELIKVYAALRRQLGMTTEPLTDDLVKNMPLDSLQQIHYQQFINAYFNELDGKTFDFILAHRDFILFENKLKLLVKKNFELALLRKDKKLFKKVLKANSKIITDPTIAEAQNKELTLKFEEKKD
jgi:thioredoxin-related protein